jgi:hypothetical protein
MSLLRRLFGEPTLADVARAAADWLRAAGVERLETNLERGEIVAWRDGSSRRLFLGNLLHAYRQAPRRDRKAVLENCLAALVSDDAMPDRYEDARAQLLPVVRNVGDIGVVRLAGVRDAGPSGPIRPAARPFVADLVVALVVDRPTSMMYVNEDTLAQWNVAFEDALADALDNLRAQPEHGGWHEVAPGVWSGEWGDAYESSRLLLPDLVHRLGVGRPVAMAPFRDALLVTSADNDAGLQALARLAQASAPDSNRWLSFKLLRLDERTWRELEAPDHARESLRELDLQNQGGAYASQKELLDAMHESQGVDIFVAAYGLLKKEGTPLASYAVWSDGVDTLLPVADHVAFVHREGETTKHALLPWGLALDRFGGLMERTEHEPARYRVRGYPERAIVERLGAAGE